jgi:hypothetical protein
MTAHTHPEPRAVFHWRAFTSLLVLLGFTVLATTGVGLYMTPPGRVANWSGWTLAGLTKAQWQAVHMVFGFLFVAASGLHLFFNWRVLMSYLRSHVATGLRRKREIAWSLGIGALLLALSIGDVPPVSQVAATREAISNSWSDATTEPPIPHAELLTLARFAEAQKLPIENALGTLRAAGAKATAESTLAEIAVQLETTPQEVYRRLGAASPKPAAAVAGGGMGWKTLRAASQEQGIPLDTAIARLSAAGIAAQADLTLREIASRNNRHAPELLALIKADPAR